MSDLFLKKKWISSIFKYTCETTFCVARSSTFFLFSCNLKITFYHSVRSSFICQINERIHKQTTAVLTFENETLREPMWKFVLVIYSAYGIFGHIINSIVACFTVWNNSVSKIMESKRKSKRNAHKRKLVKKKSVF